MQLTNTPGKLVLPFANAGAKNTIPTASQIGITAGAASLTDGFPPLTRTPIAAGGVPPSGLDMNGILYELSAILRWANAGGGYAYDSTFANDSNVNGYPKGARIMRSDGLGYWFNTVENNTTDPEAAGAAAAGWVPDFTNGVTSVAMASANVTLTPLQYGKPIIVITGTLTANLNLIFPSIAGEWTVINNTTGAYSITCKTAAGTGVVVNSAQVLIGDGVNIYNANLDATVLLGANVGGAGGTADALTVTLGSTVRSWAQIAGIPFWVRAASANATGTPTLAVNGLAAKTEVKGAGAALVAGDHAGAGHWLLFQYDATLDTVVLLNPATGIISHGTQSFTSGTSNFTVPVGITTVWVTGAAGGGGGGGGGTGQPGGGGGAGQSVLEKAISVTPGAVISVTIGAAGNGGAVGGNGTAGGNTTFGGLLTLTGGGAGLNNGTGGASGGGMSQSGQIASTAVTAVGGKGGGSALGDGGHGGLGSNTGAPAGGNTGAGGGGGTGTGTGTVGASGGAGILIVRW